MPGGVSAAELRRIVRRLVDEYLGGAGGDQVGPAVLGVWQFAGIPGAAGEMGMLGADQLGIPLALAGTLVGIAVNAPADIGAAGNSVTVTAYKNGVATALTATITGGAGTERKATNTGSVAVAQGDEVTLYIAGTGAPLSQNYFGWLWLA